MSDSTLPASEPNSTSALVGKPGVLVARKHHLLVRWSHWLNVPILLGLIVTGISIYWASPVYQHKPDPHTGSVDAAADTLILLLFRSIRRIAYDATLCFGLE